MAGPKILLLDIETAPIEAWVWSLWQQDVALNQIKEDWFVISWAAKWLDEEKMFYADQRSARSMENDKKMLKPLWKLIDHADILITQNGKKFDAKKLNTRFVLNGYKPPAPYRHIDTLELAKKNFAFTSNKLEYMTDKLNKKYKKLKHSKFPGFDLWRECMRKNKKAWHELEKYNKHDVLALEELYHKISPWGTGIDFNVFSSTEQPSCNCGHPVLIKYGYAFTNAGKYQRYKCGNCGASSRGQENLLNKQKRKELKKPA